MTSDKTSLMHALSLLLIFFGLIGSLEDIEESEKVSNKLRGWEFRSYNSAKYFLPSSKNQKIIIISLIDGTLMAIDSNTGIIFWTIKENKNLISRECSSFGCYFFHSTSDHVYFLIDGVAHLISSDTFGWIKLEKVLNIANSRTDTVTLGINVLTGKFYFFNSAKSCFKNSSDSSKEILENLLIVKRTSKIYQVFDVDSQQEILKLSTVSHEISSYYFNEENIIPPSITSFMDYDISQYIIYGRDSGSQSLSENCWSISLNSPINKIWQVSQTSTYFTVIPIDLINIISYNSQKISNTFYNKFPFITAIMNKKSCNNHLIQINFKKYSFLQDVGPNLDKNCFLKPIVSTFNISTIFEIEKRFSKRDFLLKHLKKSVNYASKLKKFSEYIENYVTIIKHLKYITHKRYYKINYFKFSSEHERKISHELRPRKRIAAKKFMKEFLFTLFYVGLVFLLIYLFIHQYQLKYHPVKELKTFNLQIKPIEEKRSFKSKLFRSPDEIDSSEESECQLMTPTLFSRYSTEFHHLKNIGVGGYGVVFKARNYMDKCVYAVKRITVSDCIFARERTIREVQALAQLNHSGIIRFYAAWFEQGTDRDISKLSRSINGKSLNMISYENNSRTIITENNSLKTEDPDIVFEYDSKHPRPTTPLWDDLSNDFDKKNKNSGSIDSEKTFVVTCHGKHGCQHLNSIYLYIQMELCHKETLRSFLIKKPNRYTPTVLSIFEQILNAVKYFHSRKLMHRDLKPSNIFFSFEGCVKIGDFGLVTRFNLDQSRDNSIVTDPSDDETNTIDTVTKLVGTELYMAPELFEKRSYDFKVDIYSLGLIFFELLVPFYSQYQRAFVMAKVKELNFSSECKELSSDSIELIKLMMSRNPNARPSISQLLSMDITSRILREAESLEETKQKIVKILAEIHDIHIYSDCSL